ncbi:MAG: GTP cyclohydrolase I FolE [Acidobacteria bacterium]|nr:GTP cyclohydrolase I FolE [Acidobacteriota bacterium]MBI3658310.1 GTP cyclohydrolase I FolE [Acidobacteriota bacterium]
MLKTAPVAERKNISANDIRRHIAEILEALGESVAREGLKNTPLRVERMLKTLTSGNNVDIDKLFGSAKFKVDYDEMVVVKNIDFFSLCEHHLLPFFGRCHVAYVPNKYVVGLSKIPRLVEALSRRLQVQERLTAQIAQTLQEKIQPLGVGVVIEAQHMCMIMRGVQKINSQAITSTMLGAFRSDPKTRLEFLDLIR